MSPIPGLLPRTVSPRLTAVKFSSGGGPFGEPFRMTLELAFDNLMDAYAFHEVVEGWRVSGHVDMMLDAPPRPPAPLIRTDETLARTAVMIEGLMPWNGVTP